MDRQDYPAMLPQLQPAHAVEVLDNRVRQIGRLNTAIADWLQARRQLEDQYSAGLRSLARKQLDVGDLGVFSVPWSAMTTSLDTVADAHSSLATRIEFEIEQPLRDFASSNRDMSGMSNMQGNLAALARDVERAQQKTDKLKGKGDRAETNKLASANSDLDSAQSQWDSQAPFVFESLQAADETRVNHLRDLLTQFETIETDQLEKSRQASEQCLNVLLNVQTEDEIKTFVLKALQTRPSLSRAHRSSVAPTPSRSAQASPAANLSPSVSRTTDDGRSQRTGSLAESTPDEKPKSRLGGLKRFGTVMSRRRESRIPPNAAPPSQSPERKQKTSALGRMGKSRGSTPDLAPVGEGLPAHVPSSPFRMGSEIFQSQADRETERTGSIASAGPTTTHVNGTTTAAAGLAAAGLSGLALTNGSHQNDLADLDPPKADVDGPSTGITGEQQDSEGFTVPTQTVDPITQAQQEAFGGAPQYNVNIRDTPIAEDRETDDAALSSVASRLQAPPPTSRRANTVRGRRADRSSAFVNSVFIPGEQQIAESPAAPDVATRQAPETAALPTVAPTSQTEGSTLSGAEEVGIGAAAVGGVGAAAAAAVAASSSSPQTESLSASQFRPDSRSMLGDTQSIRSAATSSSQAMKHPELPGNGLQSSIIETIGARFDNGRLSSSTLIGEIALAHNAGDVSSPFGTERIRLENFSHLDKVAPNPAFITQIPDRDGEYTVSLASIARTQIAFKYQARAGDGSQTPLVITPAFRMIPNQASVIVTYTANPAFAPFATGAASSITLSNVTIALTLEGARASGCQSKPLGTFSREKNLIFWQLGDLTLTPGAAPAKLLARFATDAEAKAGSVDAKWEINGEAALAVGSGLSVSAQGQAAGDAAADPFADESHVAAGGFRSVGGVKKVVSGLYVAR